MPRRELGLALVDHLERQGLSPGMLAKAAGGQLGPGGGKITDLSQLAMGLAPLDPTMGAPFASLTDDPRFSASSMGPGTPATPFPLGGEPRQWQYRTGFNFPTPPATDRGIDAGLLRTLADGYDLLRKCIEVMKNEIAAMEWDIVPKERNRRKREQFIAENADDLATIKQFFEWPEAYMTKGQDGATWVRRGIVPWQQWISAQLEEYYVGDWMTIWPRRMRNGKLLGFDRVDGSTIKPLVDLEGRTPTPPLPAFQQYLYGVPRASFTLEEILYRPRNLRNHTVYGFSHVEQMLMLVNLALRFQMWNTQAYTDGSLPLGLLEFPENFAPEQIQAVVDELNATISGLSDERQKFHGVPSGTKWNTIKPFEWDESFAQYMIEYTCALFGLNAQKLGFMPARGGAGLGGSGFAQQQADNTDSHEMIPTARWVQSLCNELIERCLGRTDVSFEFTALRDQNEQEQIEADQAAMFAGQKSWDQILEEAGEDPVGVSEPFFVVPGSGLVMSVADIKRIQEGDQRTAAPGLPLSDDAIAQAEEEAKKPPPPPFGGALVPGGDEPPPGDGGDNNSGGPGQRDPSLSASKPPETPAKPDAKKPGPASAAKTDVEPGEREKAATKKTFDLSSGMQPHDLGDAHADELRRWKRKTDRDLRAGREPREFQTDVLPEQMKTAIAAELTKQYVTIDEARAAARETFDPRIAKAAAKETTVAGIAVLADDTGRILMLQRSIVDKDDPAAGTWEFPGGHLEDGEEAFTGAKREWEEELGAKLPAGEIRGSWKRGIYEGFLFAVAHEADVNINLQPDDRHVLNPDDPDGDDIETAAWWDPAHVPQMPALREECSATPWDLIERATPPTADITKAATPSIAAGTKGEVALERANYRSADNPSVECATCAFFAAGHCSMFEVDVDADYVCDDWQSRTRKQRTEEAEKAIGAAVTALLIRKRADAKKSGDRAALELAPQDVAGLADAFGDPMEDAYMAGRNNMLQLLGRNTLQGVDADGQASLALTAQERAEQLATAYQAQLDKLAAETDLDNVIDGVERFESWKANQVATDAATTAYNRGALQSAAQFPSSDQFDWATEDDDRVCEDCQDRADGGPYGLDEILAMGEDGLHPGDRCEWEISAEQTGDGEEDQE